MSQSRNWRQTRVYRSAAARPLRGTCGSRFQSLRPSQCCSRPRSKNAMSGDKFHPELSTHPHNAHAVMWAAAKKGETHACDSDQKCPARGSGGQERNSQRHARGTRARLFRQVLFNRPRSKWPTAPRLNAACILGTTSYILECSSIIHEFSKMKQQSNYKLPGHEALIFK